MYVGIENVKLVHWQNNVHTQEQADCNWI